MRKFAMLAGAATLLMATASVAAQPTQPVLVLQGGTLIDGTGKPPVPNSVIVVQGERITAVGRRGEVAVPRGAKIIDTTGLTVLPGLIDSHTHTQEWHYPLFTHWGITTIQDKNNDPPWMLSQKEALQKGWMTGPRLYSSGATIHGMLDNNGYNTPPALGYEDTKAYAEAWVKAGFDSFNTIQWITNDQRRALIEVADANNIPVMGHVRNMKTAVEQGYKYAEHMFGISAAVIDPNDTTAIGEEGIPTEQLMDPAKFKPLIDFMVSKDVTINPTLAAGWIAATPRGAEMSKDLQAMAKDPNLAFVPDRVKDVWARGRERRPMGYDNVKLFLKQYVDAGGHVSVGTDSSGSTAPGLSEHYEMQALVDVGLTPMQALQAATSWNAHLIRHDKDIGSVEPGKYGDFTIIKGDPLQDIRNTMNVQMVIKAGTVQDRTLKADWANPIPAPFSTYNGLLPASIQKLTPAIVRQNSPTVTLTIEGLDAATRRTVGRGADSFSPASLVRLDNVDLPTTFVNGDKLTVTVDAKLLQREPGLYPLYIIQQGLRGSVSPAAYLVIDSAAQPVKVIPQPYATYAGRKAVYGQIENERGRFWGPYPRGANQGSGKDVPIRILGTRFAPDAVVMLDNIALPTKFVSDREVSAIVPASVLEKPVGSYVMYVLNPGVYGNISEGGYFQVGLKNAAPKPMLPEGSRLGGD